MTESKKQKDHATMMDGLYWWGVPTLFRCPHNPDPAQCDIGLVGVPHSTGNGTTERDQHLGPRAVRNVSALGRRVHMKFNIDPWRRCRISDLGDVPLPEANNNERCIEHITQFYRTIDAAAVKPVSIGGCPLYITFDLDCLDPTVASGVANIEAGCEGLRMSRSRRFCKGCAAPTSSVAMWCA